MNSRSSWIYSIAIAIVLWPGIVSSQSVFLNVTNSVGINHTYCPANVYSELGAGVSFRDFNMDGFDDITFPSHKGDSLYCYTNDGNGAFIRSAFLPSGSDTLEIQNVFWVDIDNDGDRDLFLPIYNASNKLFLNDGGNFIDISSSAGLDSASVLTYAAACADYDLDGYVDIFVTNRDFPPDNQRNYLYRNNGDNTFDEVAIAAGVSGDIMPYPPTLVMPLAVSFVDYNNDMYPDIFIANDKFLGNIAYENNGDGTFTDISVSSGFKTFMDGMCVAQGDYDNDGDLDVYVTNAPQAQYGNELFRNNGDGTFDTTAWSNGTEVHLHGWGANFLDFDNDTHLDLFVCNSSGGPFTNPPFQNRRNVVLKNDGTGNFTEIVGAGPDIDTTTITYGTAMGDFNNDGYYDLVTLNTFGTYSEVFENIGGSNNYLKFRLKGTISNRDAIGVWLKVYQASDVYSRYTHCGISYGSQNTSDVIVGLAQDTIVDSVYVMWPSGIVDKYYNVQTNQILDIDEGDVACSNAMVATTAKQNVDCNGLANAEVRVIVSGGSPPYSYRWNTTPESTTSIVTGLDGGSYQVEISDSENCVKQATVSVFEPSAVFVSAIPNFPGPGDINLLVSGGIAPYSYNWSNGSTTEDVTGLAPGFYFVQVTDRNGCAKVFVVNL